MHDHADCCCARWRRPWPAGWRCNRARRRPGAPAAARSAPTRRWPSFTTREAVVIETPARSATSCRVTRDPASRRPPSHRASPPRATHHAWPPHLSPPPAATAPHAARAPQPHAGCRCTDGHARSGSLVHRHDRVRAVDLAFPVSLAGKVLSQSARVTARRGRADDGTQGPARCPERRHRADGLPAASGPVAAGHPRAGRRAAGRRHDRLPRAGPGRPQRGPAARDRGAARPGERWSTTWTRCWPTRRSRCTSTPRSPARGRPAWARRSPPASTSTPRSRWPDSLDGALRAGPRGPRGRASSTASCRTSCSCPA